MPIWRDRLRARRTEEPAELPPVPNPEGKKLMGQGHFGTNQYYVDQLKQRKNGLASSLMWREFGIDAHSVHKRANQHISQVSQLHLDAGRPASQY